MHLSELRLFGQRLNSLGPYQTYNSVSYGPTFGGGFDLGTQASLNWGNNNVFSYGAENDYGTQQVSGTIPGQVLILGQIEIFTVTRADTPPPVPEPQTYALLLAGHALVGAATRRRQAG